MEQANINCPFSYRSSGSNTNSFCRAFVNIRSPAVIARAPEVTPSCAAAILFSVWRWRHWVRCAVIIIVIVIYVWLRPFWITNSNEFNIFIFIRVLRLGNEHFSFRNLFFRNVLTYFTIQIWVSYRTVESFLDLS